MINLGTLQSCPSVAGISRCFIGAALLVGSGACSSDILGSNGIDGISLQSPTGYFGPDGYPLVVGDSIQLHAVAYHSRRECSYIGCDNVAVPVGATFTWHTSDSRIAVVSNGLVRAVGRGVTNVVAAAGTVQGTVRIRVGVHVALAQMSTHGRCALTETGAAYCWDGLLFNSPDEDFGSKSPRLVGGGVLYSAISTGSVLACGIGSDARGYCWGYSYYGDLIPSGLPLRALSVGTRMNCLYPSGVFDCSPDPYSWHSCAVAVNGGAYCWGANDRGQLGTDSVAAPVTALPVTGGHSFTTISVGDAHTCALTGDGVVYCWGDNDSGQLGDSLGGFRSEPAPMSSVPPLVALAAGRTHTCGLTSDGRAFCWGAHQPTPARVGSDLSFRSIDAGGRTCATTVAGQVYCWGGSYVAPTQMAGGLTVRSVGVSWRGTVCGVATDGHVYCWDDWGDPVRLAGPIQP